MFLHREWIACLNANLIGLYPWQDLNLRPSAS